MEQTKLERMRNDLIQRELDTTPWEAIVDLAVKKVSIEVEQLKAEDVRIFMTERLQQQIIDYTQARALMVEHIITNSTRDEVIAHVRQALAAEYENIAKSDIETLHRLFIVTGSDGGKLTVTSVFNK